MKNFRPKLNRKVLLLLAGLFPLLCSAAPSLPVGLMLNLDFQQIKDGLIPSKTLYPLYVPLGKLDTQVVNQRNVLIINDGQGLNIPHSSLLDPNGTTWVASIQVVAKTDGIILSQYNDTCGYVIYLKDGIVHATILSGASAITLKENPENGIGSVLKKRVTIELKIGPQSAILILNRNRVAYVPLQKPLSGKDLLIRLGEHSSVPTPLKYNPAPLTKGFTGEIRLFKMIRQTH
jgi:hypothetical protein